MSSLTCLVESVHFGEESATNEPLSGLRVVEEPNLERHHTLQAEVNLLDHFPLLPVVDVEVGPVVPLLHVSHVQTWQ